jgi:hypothetical protein
MRTFVTPQVLFHPATRVTAGGALCRRRGWRHTCADDLPLHVLRILRNSALLLVVAAEAEEAAGIVLAIAEAQTRLDAACVAPARTDLNGDGGA